MKKYINENPWNCYWIGILVMVFVIIGTTIGLFETHSVWTPIFLQLSGTFFAIIAPVFAMLIIMIDNDLKVDKATNDKLFAIQELSKEQKIANQIEFQKLVKTINDSAEEREKKLFEATQTLDELVKLNIELKKSNEKELQEIKKTIIGSNNEQTEKIDEIITETFDALRKINTEQKKATEQEFGKLKEAIIVATNKQIEKVDEVTAGINGLQEISQEQMKVVILEQ